LEEADEEADEAEEMTDTMNEVLGEQSPESLVIEAPVLQFEEEESEEIEEREDAEAFAAEKTDTDSARFSQSEVEYDEALAKDAAAYSLCIL